MVIGNGLLAKRFSEYSLNNEVIIFASGVSDSKLQNEEGYERELLLLFQTMQQYPEKLLVYFSTCSVLDRSLSKMPYIRHKFFVERLIQQRQEHYLIFRISNLAGHGGNPKTIMNYLVNMVKNRLRFELWFNAYRNIIDIDDAYLLIDYFIRQRQESAIINIANPVSYSTLEIVQAIELFSRIKANYSLVQKGDKYFIDTIAVEDVSAKLGINFSGDYLQTILQKYYSKI